MQCQIKNNRKLVHMGNGQRKAESHTETHPGGQGQTHRQGRGCGGRGRSLQAPPSHSDPAQYLLGRLWRTENAVRDGYSPSPQLQKHKEAWRKTASSDGTRNVPGVLRSESVHGRRTES